MKLRIRRMDKLSWALERFDEGGVVTNLGVTSKDRWTVTGYHPSLVRAAQDALQEAIPVGTCGAEDIIAALTAARDALVQACSRANGRDPVEIDVPDVRRTTSKKAQGSS